MLKVKSKIILGFITLLFTIHCSLLTNYAQTAKTALENQLKLVKEFDVNGLKVLVKQRASSPTVSAGLFLRGGVSNINAQNAGIENLMLDTMTIGSKKFPREVMRKELSRMGSGLGAGVNYDFSVLSFASTKQHFQHSWEIFTDVALNPSFDAKDIDLSRDKILTTLRDDNDSPDSFLSVLESKIIYAKHPYSNEPRGTVETISKLKPEDLLAYHQKTMETSKLLLVIVGNLDDLEVAALQKQLTESFGKLPRGNYKTPNLPSLAFNEPTLDVTDKPLETNYVKGVFAAPNLGDADYYAMRVAMTILQQRVYQEVRVRQNLSYAPSADMESLLANSASIYVTSNNANKSVDLMLAEIDGLKKIPVEQADIGGIMGYFLTTYFLKQETNAAQAAELALYELTGNGWKNSGNFLDGIKKVTSADIQRVSNKYMKNLRFIFIGNPKSANKSIFLQK